MKALIRLTLSVALLSMAPLCLIGQEWTKAQLELWQVVEGSRARWKAGDIDGFGSGLHEKYQAWDNKSPLPYSKEQVLKKYKEMKETARIDHFSFNPGRITVTENAAVVDYYFEIWQTLTLPDNKKTQVFTGKNVEFYVKEKGKWLLLGDMTSFDDNSGGSR